MERVRGRCPRIRMCAVLCESILITGSDGSFAHVDMQGSFNFEHEGVVMECNQVRSSTQTPSHLTPSHHLWCIDIVTLRIARVTDGARIAWRRCRASSLCRYSRQKGAGGASVRQWILQRAQCSAYTLGESECLSSAVSFIMRCTEPSPFAER